MCVGVGERESDGEMRPTLFVKLYTQCRRVSALYALARSHVHKRKAHIIFRDIFNVEALNINFPFSNHVTTAQIVVCTQYSRILSHFGFMGEKLSV